MPNTQQTIEAQVKQYEQAQAADAVKSAAQKAKDKIKAQIGALNRQIKAIEADNKSILQAMSDPQYQIAILQKQAVQAAIDYGTPGHPNYTSSEYTTIIRDLNFQQKLIDGYKVRLANNNASSQVLLQQIKNIQHPVKPPANTPSKGNSTTIVHTSTPNTSAIQFNAPMVSQAYFRGIQSEILHGNYVKAGPYTDAKNTWSIGTNGTPITGRGAFQVDRSLVTAANVADAIKSSAYHGSKIDTNLYGFKFLYNPSSVSMNWGAVQKTDPTYQSLGLDPFVPGTQNLIQSYLEFSIIINRIEDFNFLDKNGLKKVESGLTQRGRNSDLMPTSVQVNPYPKSVPNSELIQIFEKGTMYDIEYLFKTMHALTGNIGYKSLLMNDITSDPGWLPVRPVELHLGNKLRYKVRVQNLTVNHTVFNPRMIPILSTVTFTCARYWDSPDYSKNKGKK
jgi:hypothetical protein